VANEQRIKSWRTSFAALNRTLASLASDARCADARASARTAIERSRKRDLSGEDDGKSAARA